MKIYKCLGCRFENNSKKMDDNICPYCGEFMEEINEDYEKILDEDTTNE